MPGAESCIAAPELAREVEARLGRSVFVSVTQADMSVEGHVEPRKDGGWRVLFTLRDATGAPLGTRELLQDEADCTSARDSIILVVSVMIDPDAALKSPVPTKSIKPSPPPRRVSGPWRSETFASAKAGIGILPNASVGFSLSTLLVPLRFVALELSGTLWFDNTASTQGPGRADFSLGYGSASACPLTVWRDRWHLLACASGLFGRVHVKGSGFDVVRPDDSKFFVASAFDTRVEVRLLGPLALRASASLIIPIVRNSFVFTNADSTQTELFRMAPLAATGELGVGVTLP